MLLSLFLLSLQVILAGIGLWWMLAKRLHYAGYEIPSPLNFYMGALLFFQLPLYFFAGQSAGAAEVIRAAVNGQTHIDAKQIRQRWSWLHPTIVGSSVGLAALVGVCSIRPEKVIVQRHQAPVGVRDYVREHQRAEKRETETQERSLFPVDHEA